MRILSGVAAALVLALLGCEVSGTSTTQPQTAAAPAATTAASPATESAEGASTVTLHVDGL